MWQIGAYMIDFEEELAKFKPSLEVDQAEDAIYSSEFTDITDLLNKIFAEHEDQ